MPPSSSSSSTPYGHAMSTQQLQSMADVGRTQLGAMQYLDANERRELAEAQQSVVDARRGAEADEGHLRVH